MKDMKKSFANIEPYHSGLIPEGIILNANESPLAPPKCLVDEFKKAIKKIEFSRYPDMDEVKLNEAIAKRYGINPNNVSCGVGSDELLDVMFRATLEVNDKVLGFSPSFSMYQVFTELVGAKYIPVYGDSNMIFHVDDMIKAIKEYNPKVVLVCTPNNPTGQYLSKSDVRRFIESTDALIGLDLAYIDLAKEDYTKIALEYDNVIAFKTFSKAMALPSIRLGYAISNKDNIDMLSAIKAPYSVTTFTQMVGEIAINHFELYKNQIEEIKRERERIYHTLKERGYNIYPSEANFLYVFMDDSKNELLVKNKIYIRKFKIGVYRITVGTKSENDSLLEVLK
jgi:histidinol-phosphate aminotransferase